VIPYSATLGYATLLDRLSVSALAELDRLMASVANESPEVQQEALMDLLPILGDQYVGASSLVSAQFFTELQDINGVRKPVPAETLDGVGAKRWHSLAGWGSAPAIFEQGGAALVYSLLSGGLTKILTEAAADTMVGNAEIQGSMRAQRVPRSGCCAFCGMLASRFADYESVESATTVVGRGVPVGKGRGHGSKGKGRGIKARGARAIGEEFHDHCRCRVVVLTKNNYAELQSTADKYYDSYSAAAQKAGEGRRLEWVETKSSDGSLNRQYTWVNAEGKARTAQDHTKDILAAMRQDLGVR